MRTKLQLYTVPGQVYYNSTRQLVLKGADGIVFVADSQDFALDANLESLQNLEDNLKRQGVRIREIPVVMQYNKRDLPNAMPVAEMDAEINKTIHGPSFQSVATTGIGVEETLKGVTQLVLSHLIKKYNLEGSEPIDRDIQILNTPAERAPRADSLWEEPDEEPARKAPTSGFVIDDIADESIPLVATELIGSKPAAPPPPAPPQPQVSPFEDVTDYYATSGPPAGFPDLMTEVPMASIEIQLPAGILDSLPQLEAQMATATAPPQHTAAERRATDGLVKEVSIPVNLSLDEIRNHRRLRLKITIDVNLLP
jgi:signal recognition particle receptor subunit beta